MPRRFTQRVLIRLGLPLCGWLSLALFVFIASGLPIPVPFAKDLSRPFPCMTSQCGCRNAEQCWRSCCCHTAAERLAWAKSHGVQGPEIDLLGEQALWEGIADRSLAACCHAEAGCESPASDADGISLIAALKCQGTGNMVAGVPLGLPPLHMDWQPTLAPLATIGPVVSFAASPNYSPDIPPPRSPV